MSRMYNGSNLQRGCITNPEISSSESRNSFSQSSTDSRSWSQSHSQNTRRKQKRRHDLLIKTILLGESAVGKTCLTSRFADDEFHFNTLMTIGMDIKNKVLEQDGKLIKIQCWDTAGQDKYRCIAKSYFRGADAIIFAFDITCRESFEKLGAWLRDLQRSTVDTSKLPMIVIGNKQDLEDKRIISYEQAKRWCDDFDLPYFEASARTGFGVMEAFNAVLQPAIINKSNKIEAKKALKIQKKTGRFRGRNCC